jgi:hypothetical protein
LYYSSAPGNSLQMASLFYYQNDNHTIKMIGNF